MINGIHLSLSLRACDARPQARDNVVVVAATFVPAGIRRRREPSVDALRRRKIRRKSKSRRHYAYHCVALPIDTDGTADHCTIRVKTPSPQAVAKNNHMIVARLVFFRQKRAA